jgi:hypothetical protein
MGKKITATTVAIGIFATFTGLSGMILEFPSEPTHLRRHHRIMEELSRSDSSPTLDAYTDSIYSSNHLISPLREPLAEYITSLSKDSRNFNPKVLYHSLIYGVMTIGGISLTAGAAKRGRSKDYF